MSDDLDKHEAFMDFTLRERAAIAEEHRNDAISWASRYLDNASEDIFAGRNPAENLASAAQQASRAAAYAGLAYGYSTALALSRRSSA